MKVAPSIPHRLVLLLVVAAAVALLVVLARAGDIAVTPRSLTASVERDLGTQALGRCVDGRASWRCRVTEGGATASYRVVVDEDCWTASRTGGPAGALPARADGCVLRDDG